MAKYARRADFPGQIYADHVWKNHQIPELLWHYTDGSGFLGIVNSRSLWCSEFRYLNDREEVLLFARLFQDVLKDRLLAVFAENDVVDIVATSELFQTWNVFVSAFCDEGDRNEHWQHYAKRGGYALGFDPNLLRTLAKSQSFDIGPVMYGSDTAANVAAAVIDDNLHKLTSFKSPLPQQDINAISVFFCRLILQFAPFFKPASFAREREWRLVHVAGLGDSRLHFRSHKAFGIVEYVEFGLMVDAQGKRRLTGAPPKALIPRVIVGPGNESDGWLKQSVPGELLATQGFEPRISESSSSYRFLE
ncbi:MAG: DUF2971 domain-containing protein [Propylenella sp.]